MKFFKTLCLSLIAVFVFSGCDNKNEENVNANQNETNKTNDIEEIETNDNTQDNITEDNNEINENSNNGDITGGEAFFDTIVGEFEEE